MISSIFHLTTIRRRKLTEMIHFFFKKEMKYYKMDKEGVIRFGSNIFAYVFTPSYIHVSGLITTFLYSRINNLDSGESLVNSHTYLIMNNGLLKNYSIIETLYNTFVLRKYNLSLVSNCNPSIRVAIRNRALNDNSYIANINHMLEIYIKNKVKEGRILDIFEVFEQTRYKLVVLAKNFELKAKEVIMKDLSIFRAPPNIDFYRQILNTA